MTAVPATLIVVAEFQDLQGFRSKTEVRSFLNDLSTSGNLFSDVYAVATAITAKLALASNAKLIRQSFSVIWGWAQEPTTSSGKYELVQNKARLQGGDGAGGFMSMEIPAPADAMFLTSGQDNLVVVNPASTIITNLQAAITTAIGTFQMDTPRGGHPFQQFFGGQVQNAKAPRRRVLQGT